MLYAPNRYDPLTEAAPGEIFTLTAKQRNADLAVYVWEQWTQPCFNCACSKLKTKEDRNISKMCSSLFTHWSKFNDLIDTFPLQQHTESPLCLNMSHWRLNYLSFSSQYGVCNSLKPKIVQHPDPLQYNFNASFMSYTYPCMRVSQ